MKIVTILLLLLLFHCGKTDQNITCTYETKITKIIETVETLGFSFDTSRSTKSLKIRDSNFPNDSCLLNIYRLRKKDFYCELELYSFQFDTILVGDSINTNHVFAEYLGVPLYSNNKVLTTLNSLPAHFRLYTDVIKNNSSMFIYKITSPVFDSAFNLELGNSIINAMQDEHCENIDSYFLKAIKMIEPKQMYADDTIKNKNAAAEEKERERAERQKH